MCLVVVATMVKLCVVGVDADLHTAYSESNEWLGHTQTMPLTVPCEPRLQYIDLLSKKLMVTTNRAWVGPFVCRPVSPDYDGNGIVGLSDFAAFGQAYTRGDEGLADFASFGASFGCRILQNDRECSP